MRVIKPKTDDEFGIKRKTKKVYPHLRIDLAHLPEAKKWDVSKRYKVAIEIEMTGLTQDEYESRAKFDIRGIEVLKSPPAKRFSRYKK